MSIIGAKQIISVLPIAIMVLYILECGAKNYCDSKSCRNKQHTLCMFPSNASAKHCSHFERTLRNNEDRIAILDKLNNRRNKVAAGELRSLPAAADMRKLEWNTELEVFAQRWADQCVKFSSLELKDTCRDLDGGFVGQNIATIYGESPGLTSTALVDVWYMELLSINESILSRFRESSLSNSNHYEYFSQLVWAESKEVGCGSVKFKDQNSGNRTVYRLVCNFYPGGNQVGRPVYRFGVPCSKCPENTVCDTVYKALCINNQTRDNEYRDEKNEVEFETKNDTSLNNDVSTAATELIDKETDDDFTPYDFSHGNDYTRQLITASVTEHNYQEILSVDSFVELLKKKLRSDTDFKELLFSKKSSTLGNIDTSFSDQNVAAFVNKLYSKKESATTTKTTENDLLNSTLLVDLVEAVIFRSYGGSVSDKTQIGDEIEHTTHAFVNPVRVQAELSKIQKNNDFTGHYFFPEDDGDEESSGETTEVYYDSSNMEIKDVMMEIEDIKKTTGTIDFLDEIFEADQITESSTSISPMSPDDMSVHKSGHSVMKKFLEDITDTTPLPT